MRIDSKLYLEVQEDVRKADADPLWHVLTYVIDGKEQRCISYPDELSTIEGQQKYYTIRPDVFKAYGPDPKGALLHYLQYGWLEDMDKYFHSSSWQPPTTPGMHEIVSLPGPFGMSVMRDSSGLLIGTYRQGGQAKLYRFDGALHEELSLSVESIYMIVNTPDNLPIFTTEVPAQVFKKQSDGSWKITRLRSEDVSCAFEILQVGNNLVLMAVNQAWGNGIFLFKGDINGNDFQQWKSINGRYLNFGTDGAQIKLCGSSGQTKMDYPLIANENGDDIHSRLDYEDQQYSYVIGKDGIWNLGAQSITEADGFRRAYIDIWDGKNLITVFDFNPPNDPPWTMDMQIDPATGYRWCVSSIWNESGRCRPALACSIDNGWHWTIVCEVPMPACIAMYFADNGIYLVGGEYDKYMKVFFWRF